MADAHTNFAGSLVATAPSPASSGTSLVVTATEGALFPAVPFNATVWPVNTQPTAANAEIVRVTARASDTFTITRAQEGSSARTVIVGDQICATITAKTLTDVELNPYGNVISPAQITANTDNYNPTGLSTASVLRISSDATRLLTGIAAPASDGRALLLQNVGSFIIDLVNESTSTAANRFSFTGTVGDYQELHPNQSALLAYDGTASRWRVNSVTAFGVLVPPVLSAAGTAGTARYASREDHTHPFPSYAATSTYVPAVTQSGSVTIGSIYAHYWQIGKLVFVWADFVVTGSGSAGSLVTVTLPVAAVSATHPTGPVGTGIVLDSSLTTDYPCNVLINDASTIKFRESDITTTSSWGVVPNIGLANNDTIRFFCVYEAA